LILLISTHQLMNWPINCHQLDETTRQVQPWWQVRTVSSESSTN